MTARPQITGQKPLETADLGVDLLRLSTDLLRGAAAIALEIYGSDSKQAQRRLYHERAHWPIFQHEDNGVFYAFRSRLRAAAVAKSAAQEAKIAAANKVAEVKTTTARHRRPKKRNA